MGEDFYTKEMAKYGIQYPGLKFFEEHEVEAPVFEFSVILDSPNEALKEVQEEFEKFIASQKWSPVKKSKSILSSARLSPSNIARNYFYKYIKNS
jgi:hypothetical protein